MNQVNLIGRVGGEVDLRYTPGGKAVAALTLAVDDGWGDSKKTAWIGVTIWGPTAELAKKAVQKGDRLGITGRLSQEEWEDKDGKKQRKTKVTCEAMHLLQPKRDADTASREQERRASPGMPPAPPATNYDEDEDLPF